MKGSYDLARPVVSKVSGEGLQFAGHVLLASLQKLDANIVGRADEGDLYARA